MLLGWLGLVGLVRTKVSPFFYTAPPPHSLFLGLVGILNFSPNNFPSGL